MPVRLITLDLDHTLWDVDPVLIKAEVSMLDWIKNNSPATLSIYDRDSLRQYQKQVADSYPEFKDKPSKLRQETLRRVFLQTGHNSDKASELATGAFNVFYQARSQLTLFDEVESTLKTLRNKYQIIAVTNGNADLKIAGFDHLFDGYYSADQHGNAKPAPDLFYSALKQAETSPEETVHIGDHPEQDIAAAHNLGIKTVWFNFRKDDWSNTEVIPDRQVTHWSQMLEVLATL